MALITDLPIEVLREIIRYVRDIDVVIALTKTCRSLSLVALDRLYGFAWQAALKSAIENGNVGTLKHVKRVRGDQLSLVTLASACKYPFFAIVEELLKDPRLVKELATMTSRVPAARRFYGTCPLYNACRAGNMDIVKLLLSAPGLNISRPSGPEGKTAIHGAAAGGHTDIILLLLNSGANIETRQTVGTRPLQVAMLHEQYDTVKFLLEHGADVHAGTLIYCGVTPLMEALRHGFLEIAKLLIQHGASVTEVAGLSTPLHVAVLRLQFDFADIMLHEGVDINAKLPHGRTLIQDAVAAGLPDACTYLLKKGASLGSDPSARAELVKSAAATSPEVLEVIYSAAKGQGDFSDTLYSCLLHVCREPATLKFLLESGVTATEELNAAGDTALFALIRHAVERPQDFIGKESHDCVKVLLDHGANPSATSIDGASLILYTINRLGCEVTQMLLDAGADVKGTSILYNVSSMKCKHGAQFAQACIDAGAPVNVTDKSTKSAVLAACKEDNADVLRVLLANGASLIDAQHEAKCNLISLILGNSLRPSSFIDEKHELCIRVLLEAGVSPNESIDGSITPLQRAVLKSNEKAAEELLKHGGDPNSHLRFTSADLLFPLLHGALLFDTTNMSMVNLLVKHGADALACDTNGLSILDWASALGRLEEFRLGLLTLGPEGSPMPSESAAAREPPHDPYSALFGQSPWRRNDTLGDLTWAPTPSQAK